MYTYLINEHKKKINKLNEQNCPQSMLFQFYAVATYVSLGRVYTWWYADKKHKIVSDHVRIHIACAVAMNHALCTIYDIDHMCELLCRRLGL